MDQKKSKTGIKDPKKSTTTSVDTFSSFEEGDVIDYDSFLTEEKTDEPLQKKSEFYYQDYSYVKPTQKAFEQKQVKGVPLFDTIQISPDVSHVDEMKDTSLLISGFGMKDVDSFQNLIKMSQEERRKWKLKKLWRDKLMKERKARQEEYLDKLTPRTDATMATSVETKSTSEFLSQTETTSEKRSIVDQIDYLMGLDTEAEEQPESLPLAGIEEEELEEDFKFSTNKAVREAQRYLRVHRIFECFQFIVAHLLSANAENPVEFILNILNRCLLYRSGLGEPPLLYERKHIEKLFDLMDRMQTGFIDMRQYASGMQTLGICTYNEFPERTDDGLVLKRVFVDEAYEAEVAIFNDLIKKRPEKNKQKYKKTPKRFENISMLSVNPPYFIPSDLFWPKKSDDVVGDRGQQGE